MSEVYDCPTCHHHSTIYTHTLSPGLVRMLLKFRRATIELGSLSLHPVKDLDGTPYELTKNERGNWTMLRYHGLVAKDDKRGKGYWTWRHRATDFMHGESIPAKTRVLNNEVLHDREPDGQYWVTIDELLNDASRPYFIEIEALDREPLPIDTVQTGLDLGITPAPRALRME